MKRNNVQKDAVVYRYHDPYLYGYSEYLVPWPMTGILERMFNTLLQVLRQSPTNTNKDKDYLGLNYSLHAFCRILAPSYEVSGSGNCLR